MRPSTFSIVAHDPDEPAWGVAVASKFLAAGAVVSWARTGAGAVATQSLAKVSFGPDGLALMANGASAESALETLLAADAQRAHRQVGMVDARGGSAAFTGEDCYGWAGHKTGQGFACQGNILAGPDVLETMAAAYLSASGELADRLVTALQAGEDAGGDRRGKQSAGVLVARPDGGYGGDNDRYLDLRVDDHPDPVRELRRLVNIHHVFFGMPRAEDRLPITEDIARELQSWLLKQGYLRRETTGIWDDASKQAFWALVGAENLEERWRLDRDPDWIDRVALEYLRERFR
ncbi:MAG: DUF1028 domain-containing protein [Chloroflexi bacterium]|nr:DUF1028 domain-containing protein [Chloroflexota bacterium]MDL1882416.1 DUF1028 domain-containing protein [Anaerolineae bacterium CFX8]